MLEQILPVWRGRRVLLAAAAEPMACAMLALLDEIGARPSCLPIASSSEAFCRALNDGRGAVMIAPSLNAFSDLPPKARLPALAVMLTEAREAGTPLVMLLFANPPGDPKQTHMLRELTGYALGVSNAQPGQAVSVQCIRHPGMDARSVCQSALALGARYLQGDRAYIGEFSLPQQK